MLFGENIKNKEKELFQRLIFIHAYFPLFFNIILLYFSTFNNIFTFLTINFYPSLNCLFKQNDRNLLVLVVNGGNIYIYLYICTVVQHTILLPAC